jgi:hypothetical protein
MLEDINLLITKRSEYISETIASSKDVFLHGIRSVYEDAKIVNRAKRFMLRDFQHQLKKVSTWTDDKTNSEIEKFGSKIEYIRKMVFNVYTCNLKIFMHEKQREKVNVTTLDDFVILPFIKACYLQIARDVWRKPYLLYEDVDKIEYIKNSRDFEKVVIQCIKTTLRNLIPMDKFEEIVVDDDDDIGNAVFEGDACPYEGVTGEDIVNALVKTSQKSSSSSSVSCSDSDSGSDSTSSSGSSKSESKSESKSASIKSNGSFEFDVGTLNKTKILKEDEKQVKHKSYMKINNDKYKKYLQFTHADQLINQKKIRNKNQGFF